VVSGSTKRPNFTPFIVLEVALRCKCSGEASPC